MRHEGRANLQKRLFHEPALMIQEMPSLHAPGRTMKSCFSKVGSARHAAGWSRAVIMSLGLAAVSAQAQKTITNANMTDDGRLKLEVRSVFDPMPPSGYAPLRIVATNGGDNDTRWDFSSVSSTQRFRQENEHRGQFTLLVPAHKTESANFLAPVAVSYGDGGGWNGSHQFRLTLDATGASQKTFHEYHERAASLPAIAISKGLADANHAKLKDEVEKRRSSSRGHGGGEFFGSVFAPGDLPEDWRGLSGFDFLMISSNEWQSLKPGQQLGVMQWVRLYGKLHIYATAGFSPASLGLPADAGNDPQVRSLGSIRVITWDGSSLDAVPTVSRYYGEPARVKELVEAHTNESGPTPDWGLLRALGARQFASWQVVLFLVVFGILVGPVNLFVLAPSGRRHRLFITTPLLSLGASLLMVGVILVQDGTGGMGQRLVLVDVQPQEAAAYVTQEQASRTGVLLGGGFEVKQTALIEPLALPDKPWVKLKKNSNSQATQLMHAGSQRSGNFFQSRAEQGQILRSVVSTRARLELKTGVPEGADPEIISALGFTINDLFYVDEKGDVWRAKGDLATGQQVRLIRSDVAALRAIAQPLADLSEGEPLERVTKVILQKPPRGSFFAIAGSAPGLTLETLSAIRWQKDHILVFGSLTRS